MAQKGLSNSIVNIIATHAGPINALTFSSDTATYLITGSSDRQIHLHRVEPATNASRHSTSPIQRYSAHGYPVLSLSCSLSNQTFASSGGDRTGPFLWDVSSASTIRRFGSNSNQGHTGRIPAVIFAGDDDSLLISGSDDRSVRIWDVKSRDSRPVMVWDEAKDGITCLSLAAERGNGRGLPWEVLTGSVDGRVRTYDIRNGRCITDVMPAPVVSLDVTKDGGAMLVGCMDSRLRLLDRSEGTLLQSFGGDNEENQETSPSQSGFVNTSVRLRSALSADEKLVAVGSEVDGFVRAWDVLSGREVDGVDTSQATSTPNAQSGKCVSILAFRKGQSSRTGDIWACGGLDGIARVYGR